MSENEWTIVQKRKQGMRKTSEAKSYQTTSAMLHRVNGKGIWLDRGQYSKEEVLKLREKLLERKGSLEASAWWERISLQINDAIDGRHVEAVHCLGLGSFQNSRPSCYQLACALLIKDYFAGEAKCTIADPVMNEVDREMATDFGFELIETTAISVGSIARGPPNIVKVSRPQHGRCLLWIMPHCAKELYEVVLSKCEKFGYEGMVFFSNKLSFYNKWRNGREYFPSLTNVCEDERLVERDCPDAKLSSSGREFNNLSIITIA